MPHCPICFEGDGHDDDTDNNERDEEDDEGRAGGGVGAGDEGGDDPRESTATSAVTPTKKNKKEKFLVRGKYCTHGFCRTCVERVLLVSSEPNEVPIHGTPYYTSREPIGVGISGQDFVASLSQPKHPSNVAIKGVPTQGCCPLCRARLSLFDLTWVESRIDEADGNVAKEVKKEEKKTETKKKKKGTKKKADKGDDDKDDDKDKDPSRYAYHDEIVTDWRQTPLVGKVYANMTGIGRFSFHFTQSGGGRSSSVGGVHRAPHVNVEEILRDAGSAPNRVASSKLPIRHFQWHGPSRTMRATIINTLSRNSEHDELIMCFSKNMAFLRAGARISHWKAPPSPEVMHRSFPFDGVFHTSLVDRNGNPLNGGGDDDDDDLPTIKSVLVQAHKFVRDQQAYSVRTYPDQSTVFLVCPAHLELSLKGGWNFAQKPGGPRQGDSFVVCPAGQGWFERWTMADKATGPPPSEVVYMGLLTTEVAGRYRLRSSASSASSASLPVVVPTYHGDTLQGNVFCQSDTVGLASYHFSGPDDMDDGIRTLRLDDLEAPEASNISAYISYESPQVSRWPPLDDGSRPPPRVEFRDATYDASTRTFRGSIHWLDDYGASWQQMNKWDYVMNFDTELTCIVGGNVMGHGGVAMAEYNGDGTARTEGREIARFGENLVYTNAALDEYFRAASLDHAATNDEAGGTASPAVPSSSEAAASLLRRSEAFRERLRNEGASVRTLAAVHTKWAGSQSS